MRTGLIIFGVIFLVIGALLYLVPVQQISADTTTTDGGNTDTRTSSASLIVPVAWAYSSAIIGFVLLMIGLVVPGPVKAVRGLRGPRGRNYVPYKRSTWRRSSKRLPRGTIVTTTKVTKTKR